MRICNKCNRECSDDMNFCEECGEKLEIITTEDAVPVENPTVTQDAELDSFLDEMCSMENREVLKGLISGTGAEWFGKDKEFMREVMVKFAEFKAKKNDTTDFYNNI